MEQEQRKKIWNTETEEEWELWKNERNADERRQKRNERTNEIKKNGCVRMKIMHITSYKYRLQPPTNFKV